MATSKEDIRTWFKRGVSEKDPHYMIVVCDTFDHEDYPVFARTEEEARKLVKDPGEMQRVMEVYDLRKPMDVQLAEPRCNALGDF